MANFTTLETLSFIQVVLQFCRREVLTFLSLLLLGGHRRQLHWLAWSRLSSSTNERKVDITVSPEWRLVVSCQMSSDSIVHLSCISRSMIRTVDTPVQTSERLWPLAFLEDDCYRAGANHPCSSFYVLCNYKLTLG